MNLGHSRRRRAAAATTGAALTLALTACTGGATVDEDRETDGGPSGGSLAAGYVGGIDQIGLPIGTEQGLFEERDLDVTLADPFPTGVDAINALEAGDVDIIQVGVPGLVAAHNGVPLVVVGSYSGSATQRSIDDTLSIVAAEGSGIDPEDLATLEGATVGVSVSTINHLYLLGLLKDLRIDPDDVELVNTAPPDMAIALETGGIDAAVNWDPWPITITEQVEGAYEVVRGGGYIPYVGYIVTTPTFLQENPAVVEEFLTARAASDQWIRENPENAAESAVQWLTGTELEVARAAMPYNVAQLDPRFSACTYLAMDTVARLLAEQEVIDADLDVNTLIEAGPITAVMQENPALFEDLPAIPDAAVVDAGHSFLREVDQEACAV